MRVLIQGSSAAEIASSIRAELDAGALGPGDSLPPARELAHQLGVNRNTVVAAYRQLAQAGLLVSRRGAGTTVAAPAVLNEEGFRPDTAVADVGSGNPDRGLLPDLSNLTLPPGPNVLYGESILDPGLGEWARNWFASELSRPFEVTVMGGAVDAVERLLAMALAPGDLVALEDPCFLSSVNVVRRSGFRPVPIPVDRQGMTPDGLRLALESGARVVICTPRAHNPTGASLTARRAQELRAVIAKHPQVLVIEDDHFSLLATKPFHSVCPNGHRHWALIRSLSKFLGPDLRVALVATDPGTARRLGAQVSAGTNWVSHLLQRTAHGLLGDPGFAERNEAARDHYHSRNARFVELLAEQGVAASATDGLNVWVDVRGDAHLVSAELIRRGWAARPGDEFALTPEAGAHYLRFTVHDLDDEQLRSLAEATAAAIAAAQTSRFK
ncbi:aminotransferase class I/II-fold pyridoxal phosphate-dependent enzyme [Nocardioides sp. Bht2]|uniref:aminotransferase class I/II-fold pyridoxal phosphate-dependent enzyme n=1 Tax=Nocardioides sp. Bht2 TaxID=3392297 RepID=UPI0039B4ECC2